MAGASMNDIRARIKSVTSTMQITKAMELVATSKLRLLKERAENSRPYMKTLREAIDKICSLPAVADSVFGRCAEGGGTLYIVIAGDRGLAGGYNNNIFKLAGSLSHPGDVYMPVGKKAQEYYKRRGEAIYSEDLYYVADGTVGECMYLGERIVADFLAGEFSEIKLIYTKFTSMLTQTPASVRLLPLEIEGERTVADCGEIDGEEEEVLLHILPLYIGGIISAAISEAAASECAARRSAMNSANKNAEEMIDTLMLKYNRARQAVITQEITEIVSGAEAL